MNQDQLDRIEKLLVDLHRKLDGGQQSDSNEQPTTARRIIDAGKTGGDPLAILMSTSRQVLKDARKRKDVSK